MTKDGTPFYDPRCAPAMVRWLNHAMPFAMVFAIIAVFAVNQCPRP